MEKFYKWFPALGIALVIFILSSIPGDIINQNGLGTPGLNINGHFVLYMSLAMSIFYGAKKYIKSGILAFSYGITDEIHQTFIPGRSFQLFDLVVDFIGISVGLISIWIFYQITKKKLRN